MADSGLEVPAIEQRPSLLGLEWFWEAWGALTTCRSLGMGVGPIPWTDVEAYIRAEGFSQEERYYMHIVIRNMDTVYMNYVNEKQQNATRSNTSRH